MRILSLLSLLLLAACGQAGDLYLPAERPPPPPASDGEAPAPAPAEAPKEEKDKK